MYGQSVAKELLHVTVSSHTSSDDDGENDDEIPDESTWDAEAHFTSANYQSKKLVLLLFINREHPILACYKNSANDLLNLIADRLVESTKIRKAVEGVYTGILPKGASPFVYLR